ncbi:MAG: PA14 domain-containing protein [Capsulimonas sp.]|uniref:PA14 domain-containing protein n=1 Tax=Capsulimonas sp. TaxID=2494211 RepID=UPI00326672D1
MISYRHSVCAAARVAAGLWLLNIPLCALAVDTPHVVAPQRGLSAPTDVVVKPISATRLGVTWKDTTDSEDHFEVEVSTDGTTYEGVGRTAENTTDFSCEALKPNTIYHVRVKATNSMGESEYGEAPAVATYSMGKGLTGHYYHYVKGETETTKPIFSRVDPYISFDWTEGLNSEDGGLKYNFMVVWTGQVTPVYSETYTFYTEADDGARMWVDGKQLVDDWVDHPATEKSGTVELKAGQRYDIKVAYYACGLGVSTMKLSWSSATQDKEIILPCQMDPKTAKEAEAAASLIEAKRGLGPAKPSVKNKPGSKKKIAAAG